MSSPSRRSRRGAVAVSAILMGVAFVASGCAAESVADVPPVDDREPVSSTTSGQPTDPDESCIEGDPVRFVWPDLDVDAAIEHVGLDEQGALAAPESKSTIGWYEPGWKPGSGHGNIIIEGHTYGDDSAVFTEAFGETVTEGSLFWFEMDNGSLCEYRVSELFLSIDKDEEFPSVAEQHGFFDGEGPERVFGVTCSGEIVDDSHVDVDAFFADPVN